METFYRWVVRLLPAKLIYFAYIRFMAHATCTDEGTRYTPDEMTFSKAVELWERTYRSGISTALPADFSFSWEYKQGSAQR